VGAEAPGALPPGALVVNTVRAGLLDRQALDRARGDRARAAPRRRDRKRRPVSDLPTSIVIHEEGPREGFQIEPAGIATADKIALVDALSATGMPAIQVCSSVAPRRVPGWHDAEAVVAGFTPREGLRYDALCFDARGLHRAQPFAERLELLGSIAPSASEPFSRANLARDHAASRRRS